MLKTLEELIELIRERKKALMRVHTLKNYFMIKILA